MKVVALVSGGKDSCYVMLKCLSYGHELVALAHITPPANVLESDSFMYQSVGSSAVSAMAESLRLPLFTRETSARAEVTTLSYAPTHPGDEVEDLVALLEEVKQSHPDIQAACAGALWSDYQRLRVESACARVGILSLAYLWRRNQRDLLDEMVSAGVHAVLIKVAAVGLGEEDLGKSLGEMREKLHRLEEMYGVHVCGEGGEYETLVLKLPIFQHDLICDETSVVRHSEDPVAPVLFLDIPNIKSCPKTVSVNNEDERVKLPARPAKPLELLPLDDDVYPRENLKASSEEVACDGEGQGKLTVSAREVGGFIHVVVRTAEGGAEGVQKATDALRDAIGRLIPDTCQERCSDPLGEVLYVWLRLASLSANDYASANKAYSAAFGTSACTPPPVRACVGMKAAGSAVTLEALARPGRRADRNTETLHVQSLSEWAPPCIGPYAQTVTDLGVVHICGVVPLHAPTASIPDGLGVRAQTRACMYNMSRTLEATRTEMSRIRFVVAYVVCESLAQAAEEEVRHILPSLGDVLAIVPVHALPKSALVEVRAVASAKVMDEEDEDELRGSNVIPRSVGRMDYAVVEYQGSSAMEAVQELHRLSDHQRVLSLQIFVKRAVAIELEDALKESPINASQLVARVDWLPHTAAVMSIITSVSV